MGVTHKHPAPAGTVLIDIPMSYVKESWRRWRNDHVCSRLWLSALTNRFQNSTTSSINLSIQSNWDFQFYLRGKGDSGINHKIVDRSHSVNRSTSASAHLFAKSGWSWSSAFSKVTCWQHNFYIISKAPSNSQPGFASKVCRI